MGYSTTGIDLKTAKRMTVGWTVFEASAPIYFCNNTWRRIAVCADIKEGGQVIFFKLRNGDFVNMEVNS